MSEFRSRILQKALEENDGVFSAEQFCEDNSGERRFPASGEEPFEESNSVWGVQFMSVEDDTIIPQTAAVIGMMGGRIEKSDWAEWDVYV